MQVPEIGEIIDERYQVMAYLGGGGFSRVFMGRDVEIGLVVALKILLLDEADTERGEQARLRFMREMQLTHKLTHPNIVRLVSAGYYGAHQLYAAYDFIEGHDLGQLLRREQGLDPAEAKHFMTQILSALATAHKRGIVHRDLKPDNIMITRGRGTRNAVLMDLGVASVMQESRDDAFVQVTKTGTLIGTAFYMAPEQIGGQLTPQTDLYAWGLIFLECLTGERAIEAKTDYMALTAQISAEPVAIPPLILAHPFGQIIERAVAKPLEDRMQNAVEGLRWLASAKPHPLF